MSLSLLPLGLLGIWAKSKANVRRLWHRFTSHFGIAFCFAPANHFVERQTHMQKTIIWPCLKSTNRFSVHTVYFMAGKQQQANSSRFTCKFTETGITFHVLVSFFMCFHGLSKSSEHIPYVSICTYILLRWTLSKVVQLKHPELCWIKHWSAS